MFTNEISEKYNITRQTLNTWINYGLITRPQKDKKNRWIWTDLEISELEETLEFKNQNKDSLSSKNYIEISNRRYLGSKSKLLGFIDDVVSQNTTSITTVADIFAGTGVVADHFRTKGKKIIVNDILYSNYIPYITWFGQTKVDIARVHSYIRMFNQVEGLRGYVTETFGNKYFTEQNAMIIDEVREIIESVKNDISFREYAFLLTSLIYACDKVANTVGHYDAYRKKMTSLRRIEFKFPVYNSNNDNYIYNTDANELVRDIYADLIYIDTPYNSRGYENAYHLLENIAEWKKVEVEGVARKAINRTEKSSEYNKNSAPRALEDLVSNLKCRYILLSYNNMAEKGNSRSNAKISNDEILDILERRGKVSIYSTDHLPFSAGKSNISNHKELLYLCEVKW